MEQSRWVGHRYALSEDPACGTLAMSLDGGEAEGNNYTYHMRLAVIIPTFSIVSHICAGVNSGTRGNDSKTLRVHRTTKMNSMNHLWCCNGTLVH